MRTLLTTEIEDFEERYSRFREDSLLSRLNRTKVLADPPADLVTMCTLGLEYYRRTQGLFNIGTETHQRAQGYDVDYTFAPHPELDPVTLDLSEALRVSPRKITLDPRITLDLGGLGKGFLIDKISNLLQSKLKLRYFVINGGGDIYATSDHNAPVKTYLRDPENPARALQPVSLRNQALCGSSPVLRRWRDKTHLLNPLNPAKPVTRSAFVIASTATEADILATVATLAEESEMQRIIANTNVDYLVC